MSSDSVLCTLRSIFTFRLLGHHGIVNVATNVTLLSFRRQADASPAHRVHVFAVARERTQSGGGHKVLPAKSFTLVGRVP